MSVAVALSASRTTMSCAVRTPDGRVTTSTTGTQRGAGLPAALAELFERSGLAAADVGELRVDVGPGSYTGLRVAVTFARFLARFGPGPLLTLTSFELIGVRAGRARVALDARRGRIHTALVDGTLRTQPRAILRDEFVATIEQGDVVVADDSLHDLLAPACSAVGARLEAVPGYDAGDAFDARLELRLVEASALEPLYLMGSYAE